MRRRDFITLAAAWPLVGRAQQARGVPRIGWLVPGTTASHGLLLKEFDRGMRELGYIDGRTVVIEYRYAEGKPDRLSALANELARLPVNVIVTVGSAGLVAKRATSTIPIVLAASADPVGTGVVESLARPGGNVTGFSVMGSDLSAKRLELLYGLVPRMSRVAILWHSSSAGMALRVRETQLAAERLHVELRNAGARSLDELDVILAELSRQRPDALVVTTEPFTRLHQVRILQFSARHRIPTMYEDRTYVEAGGLMSYGVDYGAVYHRSATYVDKILKGARAGELPIEQPTQFELVLNLRTAKALGIVFPSPILLRADRVIE